ncbi:glycosyltransferase family 39 protein [candidate division WOR-3 bacterium]|nr:glycosyltransferase family 39 protein [candidate division WOR-3 bacterium]
MNQLASRYSLPLILLFMVGALALRAADLRADPPPDLSWSTGPYTDEALVTYSARNLVLYGHWQTDDFLPLVVYPLVNYAMVLVFKVLDFGFIQLKLLSLVAGVLSVLVIYLLVKEDSGHLAGLLAGLLLATSFSLTMYSRLGLVETVQILFLLATGLFYVRGLRRPLEMGLAGFLGASSFLLVKASAAFVAPALIGAGVWELVLARRNRASFQTMLRAIKWGVIGVGIAACVWFVAVYLPYRTNYFQYILRHSLSSPMGHPHGVIGYLANTFSVGLETGLLSRLAWPAAIGFLTLPVIAVGRKPVFRYLGLWFLIAVLMLGSMNYRPDRYELVLVPVLLASCAAALGRFLDDGTIVPALKPTILKTALYSLWLWPLFAQAVVYTDYLWGRIRTASDPGITGLTLPVALAIGFAGYALVRHFRQEIALRPLLARTLLALAVIALTLRMDFGQFSNWYRNRTHDIVTCCRDMASILPNDAVLAGGWAPILLSCSRKRALAITDWANIDDPIHRHGVTHLVTTEGGFDGELFWNLYPQLMSRPMDVLRGQIGNIVLYLYVLPEADEQPPETEPGS